MIYVGGTLVLLVFGVMLTAQGPFVSMKTGGGQWILAAIVGGALLAVLLADGVQRRRLAPAAADAASRRRSSRQPSPPLGHGPAGRPRRSTRRSRTPTLASGMSGYLLPFEIISVHLLVVLIGAAYLARAKR